MKGEEKVIDYLNRGLRSELTAVSQYWLHYRLQNDWGYTKLAKKSREESIEEMHHADKLIDRIIFLEGHPNLQTLDPLRIGQNVKETLECDLAAEYDAQRLPGEVVVGRADAAGDDEQVTPTRRLADRLLDGPLVVAHGHVCDHPAPDGRELLADPGGVGVNGLAEHELVADGEDDGVHGRVWSAEPGGLSSGGGGAKGLALGAQVADRRSRFLGVSRVMTSREVSPGA